MVENDNNRKYGKYVLRVKVLEEDYRCLKKAEKILENLSKQSGSSVESLSIGMALTSLRQVLEVMDRYRVVVV
jgi:DNA-binding ferritin-like protein (Dps family)